jgi:hypothetical protein
LGCPHCSAAPRGARAAPLFRSGNGPRDSRAAAASMATAARSGRHWMRHRIPGGVAARGGAAYGAGASVSSTARSRARVDGVGKAVWRRKELWEWRALAPRASR